LHFERELWKQGYRYVAGIDEVGRGAWAGPVVAAAVIFPPSVDLPKGLADSKKLTAKRREELDKEIQHLALDYSVGSVSVGIIEKYGIANAAQRAMRRAIRGLNNAPDYHLIDYFELNYINKSCQRGIKKGDVVCASIAAASILAKVYRDDLMRKLDDHAHFSVYRFGKHKGYGTKEHQRAIQDYGVCKIHRVSFVPDRLLTTNN
jgi:ribonuclease HII